MTKLFLDTLDPKRREMFRRLQPFAPDWVLAGGTALALQIGHRTSFDFDLFSLNAISPTLYRFVRDVVGEAPVKRVDSTDQLTVALASGIELTWHPFHYPVIPTDGLPLADVRDIAADKAAALGRRNVWRDYVDLYVLLKDGHLALAEIIRTAQQKFGNEFSAKLFLEQLSYTGDIRDTAISLLSRTESATQIRAFLEDAAVSYAKRVTSF